MKIIIDEVEFVDFGFNYDTLDGTILSINPLLVKTPNGVIELKKIRTNLPNLIKSNILSYFHYFLLVKKKIKILKIFFF